MIQNCYINARLLTYNLNIHSALELIGDVKTILYSRCNEESLYYLSDVQFGIGGGAISTNKDWALQHLGEFITINGISVWMPTGLQGHTPRTSERAGSILTPFFIKWNGSINALFYFESETGAYMTQIYQFLFDSLEKLTNGHPITTIAAVMIAESKTEEVVDKAMVVSPTKRNAPSNNKPITDITNINTYFHWNLVRELLSQMQPMIIVGIGMDVRSLNSPRLYDFANRAFYLTPNATVGDNLMLHNHAVAVGYTSIPFNKIVEECTRGKTNIAIAASALLDSCNSNSSLRMVHIENNTSIRRAIAGVGIIDSVTL